MRSLREGEPTQPPAGARTGSFGKYDLCAKLGAGGQAEVFLALMRGQAGFNKLVVIKKLRAVEGDDPMVVSRFLDEARVAARLNHPNIVHTYEVGEDDGEYFIAMEYLEGQPMNRLARSPIARKSFTPAMWARVASEALRGLGYAHNLTDYDGTPLGIVHRDVSPDNLFLTYDGEVKIVDFGIAKALLNNEKTETGTLKGKVSYMAPEQVRGVADRRADLFAMGVVLWEFFTGRKLFEGERGSVLYRLMTDPIPSLATQMPDVDPWLAAIVDRALQKDPDHRYQTAEEMREALEEYIRASNDLVPDIQLAKVVRETFAETRQRVQRQVQAAISRVAPLSSGDELMIASLLPRPTLPEIASVTPSQASRDSLMPWGSGRPTGSLPAMAMGSNAPVPNSDMIDAPMLASRRRVLLLALAAAASVALALVVFLLLRTKPAPVVALPPPAALAPVEITSTPPGARVELNGAVLGHTPGKFDLAAGPHTLIVTLDTYKAETVVVEPTTAATSRAIILTPNPVRPAAKPVDVKADTAKVEEVAKTVEPTVTPPPRNPPPQRISSPTRSPVVHNNNTRQQPQPPPIAPKPPKETPPPSSTVTTPRVKVIEDDPKRKIDVIND
jgi:serine/threonine protein kinase